jgi:hypothetical protein
MATFNGTLPEAVGHFWRNFVGLPRSDGGRLERCEFFLCEILILFVLIFVSENLLKEHLEIFYYFICTISFLNQNSSILFEKFHFGKNEFLSWSPKIRKSPHRKNEQRTPN